MRIVVIDKEIAGYASGRNGGWCSALFPTSLRRMAVERGREASVRMQRLLNETVPEVGRIAAAEGIDCHFDQGGSLSVARNSAQLERIRSQVADYAAWGFGEEDHQLLDADGVREIAAVDGALGGVWTPHCAAIHPARLVRGLAEAVERRGVTIHEQTAAVDVHSRRSSRRTGRFAPSTSCSRRGYTATVAGRRRTLHRSTRS